MLFVDVTTAHLNPVCEQDVYLMLPEEVGAAEAKCGTLVH